MNTSHSLLKRYLDIINQEQTSFTPGILESFNNDVREFFSNRVSYGEHICSTDLNGTCFICGKRKGYTQLDRGVFETSFVKNDIEVYRICNLCKERASDCKCFIH